MAVFEDARNMAEVTDGSVACIVTSPPYNIGVPYNGYYDRIPDDEYMQMLLDVFKECHRASTDKAIMFINLGIPRKFPTRPWEIVQEIDRYSWWKEDTVGDGYLCSGWRLVQTIAWVKSISLDIDGEMLSRGHYCPKQGELLNDIWEPVFMFAKASRGLSLNRLSIGVPYADKSNVTRWESGDDRRCRGNVWFVPYETTQRRKEHPATFPVDLAGKAILLGSNEGDLVLDPFVGSGTTLLAAKSCGRIGVGYDIDPSNERIIKCGMNQRYVVDRHGTFYRDGRQEVF